MHALCIALRGKPWSMLDHKGVHWMLQCRMPSTLLHELHQEICTHCAMYSQSTQCVNHFIEDLLEGSALTQTEWVHKWHIGKQVHHPVIWIQWPKILSSSPWELLLSENPLTFHMQVLKFWRLQVQYCNNFTTSSISRTSYRTNPMCSDCFRHNLH